MVVISIHVIFRGRIQESYVGVSVLGPVGFGVPFDGGGAAEPEAGG